MDVIYLIICICVWTGISTTAIALVYGVVWLVAHFSK